MSLADYINLTRSLRSTENTAPREPIPQEMSIGAFADFVVATQWGDEPGKKDPLMNLGRDYYPFLLCFTAKQYVRTQKDYPVQKVPSLTSSDPKQAALYDFGSELGVHISIPCPTTPPMYVYCKDSAVNEKDVRIVIVEN